MLYRTPTFPKTLGCTLPAKAPHDPKSMVRLPQGPVHVAINPIMNGELKVGSLVLVHDMSFVERRSSDTRKYIIIFFAVLGVIISLITVFVAHLSWRGWMAGVRAMLHGEGSGPPFFPASHLGDFNPWSEICAPCCVPWMPKGVSPTTRPSPGHPRV